MSRDWVIQTLIVLTTIMITILTISMVGFMGWLVYQAASGNLLPLYFD